jgi:hypothetical protein
MKTISNFLLTLVLSFSLISAFAQYANAQLVCDCDPDVPHLRVINHPDATGPNQQGKYTYQYSNDTIFRRTFCGANPFVTVDPCNPWTLEFYATMTEIEDDCVFFDSVAINWDSTICHDFRYEVVHPANYVLGSPSDSIAIKFTMISHQADTCDFQKTYWCRNEAGHWIDIDCWLPCLNDRISIYGHDACPIPNIVVCRIEWDSPLPVELQSFTAGVSGNNVTLNWATSSETNNSGFLIERYSEGSWSEAGFIAGKGNSTSRNDYSFVDRNVGSGAYNYRLKQIDYNGNFEYFDLEGTVTVGLPETFTLSQNYPNPFNPSTTIVFGVPTDGPVLLKVYDVNGREVRSLVNEPKNAGFYTVKFNAADLPSGMYFYKLESGNFVTTKKMILMK